MNIPIATQVLLALSHVLASGGVGRADTVIPTDSWPASWFEAPGTASELGITTFHEAPLLAARVREGKLPPLQDRLPHDPCVIVPAG